MKNLYDVREIDRKIKLRLWKNIEGEVLAIGIICDETEAYILIYQRPYNILTEKAERNIDKWRAEKTEDFEVSAHVLNNALIQCSGYILKDLKTGEELEMLTS